MSRKFADTFDEYAALMIPADADPVQREVMHEACYFGAAVIAKTIQEMFQAGSRAGEIKEMVDFMVADLQTDIAIGKAGKQ